VGQRTAGIKPRGGRQKLGCGHSKRRGRRTIQPLAEPRATGQVCGVRNRECRRTQVRLRNQTRTGEKATVETSKSPRWVMKGASDSLLEAVLGKTHRTEF